MCSTIDQARLSFSIQSQRRVTYIQMQADRRFRKSHHISSDLLIHFEPPAARCCSPPSRIHSSHRASTQASTSHRPIYFLDFLNILMFGSPLRTYFGSSTGWSPSCISFIHLVSGIGTPSGPSTHLFRNEHSRQQRSPGHSHLAQCSIRFVLVSQCTHLPQVQ